MCKKLVSLFVMVMTSLLMWSQVSNWTGYTYPYNMLCMHERDDTILFGSPLGMLSIDKVTGENVTLNSTNYPIDTNYINCIREDEQGNIWIGQVHDLAFGGENCGGITVVHPDGTSTNYNMANSELRSHIISDIAFDDNGLVWISYGYRTDAMGGISTFDPTTNQWQHYNKSNSALNANSVMSLLKDSSGIIWAAVGPDYDEQLYTSTGGGICKLDPDGWEMFDDEICPPPPGYNEDENWEVMNIDQDSQGNLWFGLGGNVACDTGSYGLYKYDGSSFTFYQAPSPLDYYWYVSVAPDDKIWVSSYQNAVGCYSQNNWEVYSNEFNNRFIQGVFTTSENDVWVSIYSEGLCYLENGSFVEYVYSDDDCPITFNSFWDIATTEQGEMYFATGWYPFGGMNPAENALISNTYGSWESWGYDTFQTYVVNDIKLKPNGNIYLGTGVDNNEACGIYNMYGGVAVKENGSWTIHNFYTTGYPYLSAQCVDVDMNGNIWAGCLDGLAMYNGSNWTEYTRDNSPLYSNWITDIMYVPGTSFLWISTGVGVFRVDVSDPNNLQWECFLPNNSNLTTGLLTSLFLDSHNTIWGGSEVGLFSYENEEWIYHNSEIGEVPITKITEDEYGRFWIGTNGNGVIMWDGNDTETIDMENSCLVSNLITAIGCDGMGTLWLSSNNGGLYSCQYSATGIDYSQIISHQQIEHRNYPNPFNPETIIEFSIPTSGNVDVDIFNLKGQKVSSLLHSQLAGGNHQVIWNGRDESGKAVSSGTYFYRISFNEQIYTRKIVLLK